MGIYVTYTNLRNENEIEVGRWDACLVKALEAHQGERFESGAIYGEDAISVVADWILRLTAEIGSGNYGVTELGTLAGKLQSACFIFADLRLEKNFQADVRAGRLAWG